LSIDEAGHHRFLGYILDIGIVEVDAAYEFTMKKERQNE